MNEIETMRSWLDGEPVWPYAKIVETWPTFEGWRTRMFRKMQQAQQQDVVTFEMPDIGAMASRWELRNQWIAEFGFAVPCVELLDALAAHGPVVEVGAGTGYMTRLMRHRGIDVIGSNPDKQDYPFKQAAWDEPDQIDADAKTMVREYPERTVFCSWPSPHDIWFRQMLKAMRVGQKLIVIREDACAEETAWEYLSEKFEELDTITIPVFEHMNDFAQVCAKKRR